MRADGTAGSLAAALDGDPAVAAECLSISGHNSYAAGAAAGDTFQFTSQGGIFRGTQLSTMRAGTSGNEMIYTNYGSESPELCGANLVTTWTVFSGSVYQAAVSPQPDQVWIDGEFGDRKTSTGGCVNEYDWFWDSDVLYLYAPGDPDTQYTSPGVEASQLTRCFQVGHDYIEVDGLTFSKSDEIGLFTTACSYVTVKNCMAEWCWENGFSYFCNTAETDYTVEDCVGRYCGTHGISIVANLTGTIDNVTVQRNECYEIGLYQYADPVWDSGHVFTGGIKIWTNHNVISNCLFTQNTCYSNGPASAIINSGQKGNGIWVDEANGASGDLITVSHNLCYDNAGNGVFLENSSYNDVFGNVLYDNSRGSNALSVYCAGNIKLLARVGYDTANNNICNNTMVGGFLGIQVTSYNQSAGLELSNNTFKNNIVVDSTYILRATDGGNNVGSWGTGNVYDNNCFGAEFTDFIVWGSTLHDTYDAWEADHGEAWAQVESDPSFTDDTSDDYTLASDSPCIGGGDDLGAPYNVGLMPASTWPSGVVTDDRGDY